jgi:hypothetical protein
MKDTRHDAVLSGFVVRAVKRTMRITYDLYLKLGHIPSCGIHYYGDRTADLFSIEPKTFSDKAKVRDLLQKNIRQEKALSLVGSACISPGEHEGRPCIVTSVNLVERGLTLLLYCDGASAGEVVIVEDLPIPGNLSKGPEDAMLN